MVSRSAGFSPNMRFTSSSLTFGRRSWPACPNGTGHRLRNDTSQPDFSHLFRDGLNLSSSRSSSSSLKLGTTDAAGELSSALSSRQRRLELGPPTPTNLPCHSRDIISFFLLRSGIARFQGVNISLEVLETFANVLRPSRPTIRRTLRS